MVYKANDQISSASFAFHQAIKFSTISSHSVKTSPKIKMKAVAAVLLLVAAANAGLVSVAAPATVIQRAPALDSAVIQSDRIGGNFAYSVSEAHAHVAHTPIIQHVATPVAVSYSAPAVVAAPAIARTVVAAPVARTIVGAHHVVAAPAVSHVVAAPALSHVVAAPAVVAGTPAATVRIA